MKVKPGEFAKTRLALNLYIAIAITVLGLLVLKSVGENGDQNRRLAEQARSLATNNAKSVLESCQRGNYVRGKINKVSGAVTLLLNKSIEAGEAEGRLLTPDQKVFLNGIFHELRPLNKINCVKRLKHIDAPPQT